MTAQFKHRSPDGVWRKCQAGPEKCTFSHSTDGEARHVPANLSDEEAEAKYRDDTGKNDGDVKLTRKSAAKTSEEELAVATVNMYSAQATAKAFNDMILADIREVQEYAEKDGARAEFENAVKNMNDHVAVRDTELARFAEAKELLVRNGKESLPQYSIDEVAEYREMRRKSDEALAAMSRKAARYDASGDTDERDRVYTEMAEEAGRQADIRTEKPGLDAQALDAEVRETLATPLPQYHAKGGTWQSMASAEADHRRNEVDQAYGRVAKRLSETMTQWRPGDSDHELRRLERREEVLRQQLDAATDHRTNVETGFERHPEVELTDERKNLDSMTKLANASKARWDAMRANPNPDWDEVSEAEQDWRSDMRVRHEVEKRVQKLEKALGNSGSVVNEKASFEAYLKHTDRYLDDFDTETKIPGVSRTARMSQLDIVSQDQQRLIDILNDEQRFHF